MKRLVIVAFFCFFGVMALTFISWAQMPFSGTPSEARSRSVNKVVDDSLCCAPVSYEFSLLDIAGRPIDSEKSKVRFRLMADPKSKMYFNGRSSVKCGNIEFSLEEGAQDSIAVKVDEGNKIRVTLLAPLTGKVTYGLTFMPLKGDPVFGRDQLVAKSQILEVVPNSANAVSSAKARHCDLFLNKPHRSSGEVAVYFLFMFTAILLSWFVSSKCLFSSLVRGRDYSPSRALSASTFSTIALVVLALICCGLAWFWPGVTGPYFQYSKMVMSMASFYIILFIVWIVSRSMDRP